MAVSSSVPMHRYAVVFFALVACSRPSATSSSASVEPPIDRSDGTLPELRAPRVPENTIVANGVLDEPAWRNAGTTGGLVHPGNGRPEPSSHVQAHARFLWDERFLYVAAVVADGNPTTPFAPSETDPHLWERSSAVELMVQPGAFDDNREYYELQIDPAGARWETKFDDYNSPRSRGPDGAMRFGHQEWSTEMRVGKRTVSGSHYVLELAIPWQDFHATRAQTPPRPNDVWRANVYSFRDGQRDSLAWSPLQGRGNFHFTPRFGRIIFTAP